MKNKMRTLGRRNITQQATVDSITVANKGSHNVAIQLFKAEETRYRMIKIEGFEHALVELLYQDPAASDPKYRVVSVFVALPSGSNITTWGGEKLENITATPLFNSFLDEDSVFNGAIVTGRISRAMVPAFGWDNDDYELSDAELKNKVVASDIIVADQNGFIPVVSYDQSIDYSDTATLDYDQVRVENGTEVGDQIVPLRTQPLLNSVTGFFCAKAISSEYKGFYSNLKTGMIEKAGKKRYVFAAKVFRNGVDTSPQEALFEVQDYKKSASRAESFFGFINEQEWSGFNFNGSIRVNPLNGGGCQFRIDVAGWSVNAQLGETKKSSHKSSIKKLGAKRVPADIEQQEAEQEEIKEEVQEAPAEKDSDLEAQIRAKVIAEMQAQKVVQEEIKEEVQEEPKEESKPEQARKENRSRKLGGNKKK